MKKIKRNLDFNQFLKVLKRKGTPEHLPFYEHIASSDFISRRMGKDISQMEYGSDEYVRTYVDFWLSMGFDCIPIETPLNLKLPENKQSEELTHKSEEYVVIQNWKDFENYEWPDESNIIYFELFKKAAKYIPEEVKLVAGVGGGPYEWSTRLMGIIGMSHLMADDPELVEKVFKKVGSLHIKANEILGNMEGIGAHRQGDDLGYKSSTFLPPEKLRKWVFPTYKKMAEIAHASDRPFILHSCGNLESVYDDIIECGIDAKHSFEDVIMPVNEFKEEYGDRITPLGGLDVDVICRSSKEEIREYTKKRIEQCFDDGYWALGTGNSLTNYMPVENYITVLETAIEVMGE